MTGPLCLTCRASHTQVTDSTDPDAVYDWARPTQDALWGVLPVFLLGGALSYARLYWFRVVLTNRFRCVLAGLVLCGA